MALIFPDGSYTTNELPAGGITTLPGANTTVANPNYADLVAKQYATLGRSGIGSNPNQIDQEGYDYWINQLASGAMSPEKFKSAFLNAAANYSGPNASAYQPSINVAKDLLKPPLPAGFYYDKNGNVAGGDLPNEIRPFEHSFGYGTLTNTSSMPSTMVANGVTYNTSDILNQMQARLGEGKTPDLVAKSMLQLGFSDSDIRSIVGDASLNAGKNLISSGAFSTNAATSTEKDLAPVGSEMYNARLAAGLDAYGQPINSSVDVFGNARSSDNSNGIYATERDPSSPTRRDPWDYPTQLEPPGWYEPGGGGNPLGITPLPAGLPISTQPNSPNIRPSEPSFGYGTKIDNGLPAGTSPNYADIVNQAYGSIGRSGIGTGANQIDQEGYDYWINQLKSGALTPENFKSAFNNAAENYYINQAYKDLFGREAEKEGVDYWANTLNTTNKQEIYDAIKSGARGEDLTKAYGVTDADISRDIAAGDIYKYVNENINDPYAIFSAAEKYNVDPITITKVLGWSPEDSAGFLKKYELAKKVKQEYGDIGRGLTGDESIDKEGFNYWYNQLQSGNITPEQFEKTFLTAAADVVGKGGAGSKVAANTVVEGLSKGYDISAAIDKANPLDVYERLGEKGLTTKDILDKNPNLKEVDVNAYMAKIPDLYGKSVDESITNIFGADAASQFSDKTKQNFIDNLVAGETNREDFSKMLRESKANKAQEASRISNLYVQAFGGDAEDAKALYAKLTGDTYTGTGKVDPEIYNKAKEKFDKALTSESEANAGITSLIKDAANTSGAETRKFFTDNPDLLTLYKDVGETKAFSNAGTGGQYGYYKGIPVLKASEVDEVFDKMGTDYIQGNAPDRLDNDIGWDTGSLSAVEARGAAALGVRKQESYDENGNVTTSYSGDLAGLASKLGIDPTKYQDTYKTVKTIDPETGVEMTQKVVDKSSQDQLYDAVNEKAKDFYFIAGKTGSGKTNDRGETSAFTRNDVSGNHAAVLYKKVGDKLIPIEDTLKYYNGEMELKKGSWFSDTFGGLASIPGIAELSLLIPGVGPGTYAAIKAAQTAALGGDLGDVAKSGALAFATSKFLPDVTSGISKGLTDVGIESALANKAITGAVVGGGISGLTGKDIGTGALMGGAGGALSYGASNLVPKEGLDFANQLGIDPKYQSLFANTLARLTPTILTGGKVDPTKVLMSYMMSKAKDEAKQQVKGTT